MDAILAQLLNGLDKGGAYALIALGLTLVFGTLGVVNFAHGALFMLGAFCAVAFRALITMESVVVDETQLSPWGTPLEVRTPLAETWFGDWGAVLVDYSVPLSILLAIPVMLIIGVVMERGLIKHFYKRPHAEQILVTFGLAMVLQELVKTFFGPNPWPQPIPSDFRGAADVGALFGLQAGAVTYPLWRLVYLGFSLAVPNYHMGMDFLVLSFVVVVVGGMGSLSGAVTAGFLLGILQSFASMTAVKAIIPGIDQIIIYAVAVIILLVRPRGLMGRRGMMES
jgi:branched-chain amino acid transport system permease protein